MAHKACCPYKGRRQGSGGKASEVRLSTESFKEDTCTLDSYAGMPSHLLLPCLKNRRACDPLQGRESEQAPVAKAGSGEEGAHACVQGRPALPPSLCMLGLLHWGLHNEALRVADCPGLQQHQQLAAQHKPLQLLSSSSSPRSPASSAVHHEKGAGDRIPDTDSQTEFVLCEVFVRHAGDTDLHVGGVLADVALRHVF